MKILEVGVSATRDQKGLLKVLRWSCGEVVPTATLLGGISRLPLGVIGKRRIASPRQQLTVGLLHETSGLKPQGKVSLLKLIPYLWDIID